MSNKITNRLGDFNLWKARKEVEQEEDRRKEEKTTKAKRKTRSRKRKRGSNGPEGIPQ